MSKTTKLSNMAGHAGHLPTLPARLYLSQVHSPAKTQVKCAKEDLHAVHVSELSPSLILILILSLLHAIDTG